MSWSIKQFVNDQEMVGREDFQRTSKTRANKEVWPLSNCFSPRMKFFYDYKPFYVFDLKAIESSILFAVFRPLRTPVPNDQSSKIELWPAQIAKNIFDKGLSSDF
jgi:hypothetical protein